MSDQPTRQISVLLSIFLLKLLAILPFRVSRCIGAGVGYLMFWSNPKRRYIARVNIGMCFPELRYSERERLLRKHFCIAGQGYCDVAFLAWAADKRVASKLKISGEEHLRAEIVRKRRIILLAPHCVGMNVGGIAVAKDAVVFSMVKPQPNPIIDDALNRGRRRYGSPLVQREQGLRPVVRGLDAGMIFYYLPDEDFGPKQSVFVPFFGIPTATLTTLGRLARLTNAAVIPCFTRLLPGGQGYEVVLKPALVDFPTDDRIGDAARMNQELERGIRAMPEQYMWTFKLFKTRPGGAPSPYE